MTQWPSHSPSASRLVLLLLLLLLLLLKMTCLLWVEAEGLKDEVQLHSFVQCTHWEIIFE